MPDRERRILGAELRAATPNVLTGYAAVFNQEAEIGGFVEVIRPGAFRQALRTSDVRALWNHDDSQVLGRTKSGTLKLEEDDYGLHVRITPPKTAAAYVEAIRRGDVDQMSFGFVVPADGDKWSVRPDGKSLREIIRVDPLLDVSPVTFPAYEETVISAEARSRARMRETARQPLRGSARRAYDMEKRGLSWDVIDFWA